jgi:WD40 repeat protein
MDTHPQKPSIVATAGLDGAAKLFDYALNKQLASLEGHAKRLTGEGGCAL